MYVALSGLHVQVPALLAGKRGSHPPHRESKFPFVRVGYLRFTNMAYNLAIIMSLAPNLDQLHQSTLNLCSKFVLIRIHPLYPETLFFQVHNSYPLFHTGSQHEYVQWDMDCPNIYDPSCTCLFVLYWLIDPAGNRRRVLISSLTHILTIWRTQAPQLLYCTTKHGFPRVITLKCQY